MSEHRTDNDIEARIVAGDTEFAVLERRRAKRQSYWATREQGRFTYGRVLALVSLLGVIGGLSVWARPLSRHAAKPSPSKADAEQRALIRAAAERPPGGELRITDVTGKGLGVCPLRHTDVTGDISGFVARVTVKQQFVNTAKVPVEAVYTFPLPEGAAVDAMTMTVGERRIVGRIKRREQAQQIYQQAKAAGKTASLLNQERPNIFTQAVANVMPQQAITVEISYVDLLKYDEGEYRLSFPMTVGPRYIPGGGHTFEGQFGQASTQRGMSGAPGNQALVTDAANITPPIAPEGTRAGHDISLKFNIDAGVSLDEVTSELHPIDVVRNGSTRAVVSLRTGATLPNKDFILRYKTAGSQIETGLLTHVQKRGDGYFTLILQPPFAPPQQDVAPKEMVFVIDQTGSQSGWPIQKSKETMRLCLKRLNPEDTFQLIGFNTDVYPCFPGAVRATSANVTKALQYLDGVEAGGGTDILKSVDYALKMPDDPQRLRIICYMTDGFVGNDMQIIDYIRKNRGRARMFPFGIGNSVNRFLLEQMAREGRGAAEIVTLDMNQEQLNQLWDSQDAGNATEQEQAINRRINSMSSASNAAERFYRRIAQPVLLNPEVSWNGLPVADVYPRQIPDVFTSGPVVLRGRYTGAADGYITVSGILRGKPWQQKIHVKFPESNSAGAGAGLPSLWARARIEELQSRDWLGAQSGNPDAAIKEQIVQTALNYRLMSQFTSFVAVQEKVVNRGGVQQTVDVPIELAEGLDRQGVGSSARRARNSGGSFRVAAGQRFSGRAGDPLISVEAPSDAKRVVALLPGGEVKKLLWNVENHKWEARFDIPTYAPEGEYSITVIVVRHDDKRTRLVLRYHVDMTAPQGKGAARVAGSSQGRSASQPQRSLHLELEASAGTARVMALLPWGDKVELKAGSNARNRFATVVQPPPHWTSSQGAVTYILTDRAHNRTSVTVDLSK